jgi:hypothetical protein
MHASVIVKDSLLDISISLKTAKQTALGALNKYLDNEETNVKGGLHIHVHNLEKSEF